MILVAYSNNRKLKLYVGLQSALSDHPARSPVMTRYGFVQSHDEHEIHYIIIPDMDIVDELDDPTIKMLNVGSGIVCVEYQNGLGKIYFSN